ncbi:unnamed protein product, partial [Rotaria sp. Silwood1]
IEFVDSPASFERGLPTILLNKIKHLFASPRSKDAGESTNSI